MGKLVDPPLARAAACVQVTFCPTAEQLQPFPPPETYVNPAGSVSVTVRVPAASFGPRSDTEIVYAACCPTTKGAECETEMDRSAEGSAVIERELTPVP